MASFNPKVFIRPDGLKRIANVHLIALLEPWRAYFSWRGFAFPTSPGEEFPHEELAKILLTYDPDMPIELMNGLYYIDEAASNETLDDLLDRAGEEGIAIASHGRVDGMIGKAPIAVDEPGSPAALAFRLTLGATGIEVVQLPEPERIIDEKQEQARTQQALNVLQWENKKAVLRTSKRSLPVVQS